MTSSLLENCNWACINGPDDFENFGVPEINSALLMSLLDESQVEECDDHERLRSVIQSLEAEIDPHVDGHDSLVEPDWGSNLEDCQSFGQGQVDDQDCSGSRDLDFNWMEMEMVPSSPSDDMNFWYMDPCGDEMDGIIEFGGVRDYSHIYYGIPLEEQGYDLFLWQETQASCFSDACPTVPPCQPYRGTMN